MTRAVCKGTDTMLSERRSCFGLLGGLKRHSNVYHFQRERISKLSPHLKFISNLKTTVVILAGNEQLPTN